MGRTVSNGMAVMRTMSLPPLLRCFRGHRAFPLLITRVSVSSINLDPLIGTKLPHNPPRQLPAANALVRREDERAALAGDGAHEGEPGVAGVGGGGEVDADVLGVEGLAEEGHVVFPADGGGEGDGDGVEGCCDGAQRGGRALGPD